MSKVKEKENITKKKTLTVGLISVMIIILAALLVYIVGSKISVFQDGKKAIKEFRAAMKSEEISLIYYMHTGCQFCEMEEPILEQIAKDYDFDYITIDSSKLSKKEDKELKESLDIEGKTPTLAVVQNGEIKGLNVGYLEGYKLVEFFVKAEFLDEGSTYKPEENLTFIDYSDFENLLKEEEEFVMVLGAATCEYCKAVRPILSNISKAYNVPIYYLGLNYIGSANGSKLEEKLKDMGYDEQSFVKDRKFTTPSVLIIKDNKITSYKTGYQEMADYIRYFKKENIIKE